MRRNNNLKLSVKNIKGKNYLYIIKSFKVNQKSISINKYVGNIENINLNDVFLKLSELDYLKLTKITDYYLKSNKESILREEQIKELEEFKILFEYFADEFPDENERYSMENYVRYVHGTTAIEGNTLTLQESKILLLDRISPAGKTMREIYEVENYGRLKEFSNGYHPEISESLIKKIHEILMDNILRDPGEYRNVSVFIEKAGHEPPPAILVPEEMDTLISWINKNKSIMHPFELAVITHAKFEAIHPFVDGNGRVGRALMNLILQENGFPELFLGTKHRNDYLNSFETADRNDYRDMVSKLISIYKEEHQRIISELRSKKDLTDISELKQNYPEITAEFFRLKKRYRNSGEK